MGDRNFKKSINSIFLSETAYLGVFGIADYESDIRMKTHILSIIFISTIFTSSEISLIFLCW